MPPEEREAEKSCCECASHFECDHCGCSNCTAGIKNPEEDDSPCDEFEG